MGKTTTIETPSAPRELYDLLEAVLEPGEGLVLGDWTVRMEDDLAITLTSPSRICKIWDPMDQLPPDEVRNGTVTTYSDCYARRNGVDWTELLAAVKGAMWALFKEPILAVIRRATAEPMGCMEQVEAEMRSYDDLNDR